MLWGRLALPLTKLQLKKEVNIYTVGRLLLFCKLVRDIKKSYMDSKYITLLKTGTLKFKWRKARSNDF